MVVPGNSADAIGTIEPSDDVRSAVAIGGYGSDWDISANPECPQFGRYRGISGHLTDVVKTSRLTQSGHSHSRDMRRFRRQQKSGVQASVELEFPPPERPY
jgi:hypothetical protein